MLNETTIVIIFILFQVRKVELRQNLNDCILNVLLYLHNVVE